jgi:hypothetical protein
LIALARPSRRTSADSGGGPNGYALIQHPAVNDGTRWMRSRSRYEYDLPALARVGGGWLSRLALTVRARFGETDRDLGVIGAGELSMCGVAVTANRRPT